MNAPRYFKRDDGRICMMAPGAGHVVRDDCDAPPSGSPYYTLLTMLCGGSSYRANEVPTGPATCLGCIAEYSVPISEEEDW